MEDLTPEQTCNASTFHTRDNGNLDPVHQHMTGTWWFCDETWADCIGPYGSEAECRTKLAEYIRTL